MDEQRDNNKLPKWILPVVIVFAIVGCIGLFFAKNDKPVKEEIPLETQESSKPEEKDDTNHIKVFESIAVLTMSSEEMLFSIDETVTKWKNGDLTSEEALLKLKDYEKVRFDEVVLIANEQIALITMEMNAEKAFKDAEDYFNQSKFYEAISKLVDIPGEYSGIGNVRKLFNSCVKGILDKVKEPYSVEDYEESITYVSKCLDLYTDDKLIERKAELEEELVELKAVLDIINKATELYDSKMYEEAFALLAIGLEEYPENERIENSLVNFHDHFIIQTQIKVSELCKAEAYKEAISLIDEALLEYECEELQNLRILVREERNVLYKFKNDMVEKFKFYAQEFEHFDAKKAAGEAGTYLVKSGEKIILGDYSEEDVTVLVLTGNVVASIAGVDAFMDIRDLSYDLTHWGEEEYFIAHLAVDVVALIPAIGMIKYLDHCKTVGDAVDTTADVVDSVADVGKNTEASVDAAEAMLDTAKTIDTVADVADETRDAAKVSAMSKQITKNASKGYKYIKTVNSGLLGQKHPETGVEFVLRKLKYSNGELSQGVFPVFKSYSDVKLPKDLYKETFPKQQVKCLEELQKQVKNPLNPIRKNFTEDQIKDIKDGILPEGFTWHHNEVEGLMQLVETSVHNATNHTGGMSLWGIGYN